MDLTIRRSRFTAALVLCLWLAGPIGLTIAQEASPPLPQPDQDAAEATREQSIYIPYDKLQEVFEREGRGVFLPYDKFLELWQAARDKTAPQPPPAPPVKALISEMDSVATVSKDVVRVVAKLKMEVLQQGWNVIPLRLGDAAVTAATINEQPARIVHDPNHGYQLLWENPQRQPQQIELALEYAKAYAKSPGRNSVSFQAPQAPVSKWRVVIDEPGVKVNIHPFIAATAVPESEQVDQTVVLAFVGAAQIVKIDWTPKAEGATGLEALATVLVEQQVTVDEGVARTRAELTYAISRAELPQLLIEVPADQKVVNVFDPNVRQWSVEAADQVQHITVQLFEPARQTQRITVELEKFTDQQAATQSVGAPVVRAVSVGRQQGLVVVALAEGLRAEAAVRTGLLQVDAAELPEALAKRKWAFAYRYAALPFDLTLSVQKVQPRILVDVLVEARLRPQELSLGMLVVYDVQRAGVFNLELDIPADYSLRQVTGREIAGAQPVHVDSHHLTGPDKTHLTVNLSRKAFGRVALIVQLHKRLTEPDLLKATGKSVELDLPIPRATAATVERESGRIVVFAPESLRLNVADVQGARAVSFDEAMQNMASLGGTGGLRPVLAFAYTPQPVALKMSAERRKPHVTVGQLLAARIESGVAKYEATFDYDIRYSPVKSLRIDVPADLAADIRNNTQRVREKVIDPAPDDLAEGYIAWSLSGETELMGRVEVRLAWEKKIDELDVGKSIDLALPQLRPKGADRAWGQIVLAKAETIDLRPADEPTGLRPIDPQHDLMRGRKIAGAATAYEFHDQWALTVTATRYDLQEVKTTSIERALVRMVVTRSDQVSAQALYRMRSAQQRLTVQLPAGDKVQFDTSPLRINGRSVTLERGKDGEFFVPLVGLAADEPFLLELRYTLPNESSRLTLPAFPNDPAVQQVYLSVYLPPEWALLGSRGPWTDELYWMHRPFLQWRPLPNHGEDWLADWVTSEVNLDQNPGESFQTDGRPYLFSTLRPAPDESATLRITSMSDKWLTFIVFVIVAVGGIALLRTPAATRWLAVGLLIVVLVLCGVFMPTFCRQIVDGSLVLAILIVAVLWAVHYLVWTRPHDPAVRQLAEARQAAHLAGLRARAAPAAPIARPRPETPYEQPPADDQKGGPSDA